MRITVPGKEVDVACEVDVCVVGGSCTGVFAAVSAARAGLSVAVIEKQNCFGGMATAGFVYVWHTLYDEGRNRQIIGGLTAEVIDSLKKRDAVAFRENLSVGCYFNPEELKIELDELIKRYKITPFLHTMYTGVQKGADGAAVAVFIHNKNGAQAIKAKVFIDATGDGDVCADFGLPCYKAKHLQPPTTCAKIYGMEGLADGSDLTKKILAHRAEFDLPHDWGWGDPMPNMPSMRLEARTHVFGVDCSDADDLTYAEMEGRRTIRAYMDMLRKYDKNGRKTAIAGLASTIGIRETRHVRSEYFITEEDVLSGKRYPDAIANGSYRVDVHDHETGEIIFKYLDGRQESCVNGPAGRWREETAENPTFYQIPYRSLFHKDAPNLLFAGRMISAEPGAFGALRVMVNLNQCGQAAGAGAALAIKQGVTVADVNTDELRESLKAQNCIIF